MRLRRGRIGDRSLPAALNHSAAFAIAATAFTNDAGVAATAFPASLAYYNLYINGLPQLSSTSTATITTLSIPGGDVLDPDVPVMVEFVVT
ncbi:DUF4183 domain-containing protein [Paenibacillus apiarius]|uniref:DUF4183 domain-containing protein n=1 Tax=Paenibacillus apiarius TaxID=46240 RepID=UPI000B3B0BB8